MEGLAPVLWALLVCAGSACDTEEPGLNLSCYQCFKVSSQELCTPVQCHPTDRVCVSSTVVLMGRSRVIVKFSKRCAPRCPNTNMEYEWPPGPAGPGKIIRQCCSGYLCNGTSPTSAALPGALLLGAALRLLWALL
ncbi:lymphocyte antigen 6L isoform X2 [Suricata suricatta]|uniref:lymphocyte antigen 6L isoform X2 n=1 Tax=Suricata suricatta TaxID=37032 RepID=UPI0011557877|nr:lymphocyte antigen 6L isoform X2 [Suricata suricatta]XP_029779301.1 lymphocyte antigen 6L isoform X2 [Suricata suricatta]